MLNIIQEIKKEGLTTVVDKYKLLYKDCGHKFLLKYNQSESRPFKHIEAVKECRGLVLAKGTLKVLSYPFKRFFNIQETEAAPIDWKNAKILKKEDGSLMGLYFDPIIDEWCVQTSGTADAKTNVGTFEMTFERLFFDTLSLYTSLDVFDKEKNYIFELCTAANRVVKLHDTPKLVLLNVRDLNDLSEASYEELVEIGKRINIPAVEAFNLSSIETIIESVSEMPYHEEGFVVFDGKNRVKIKNPKYLLAAKQIEKFSPKYIFTVINEGEKDEFIGILPQFKKLFEQIEGWYNELIVLGEKLKQDAINFISTLTGDEKARRKQFAQKIISEQTAKSRIFTGELFKLFSGDDFDVKDFLKNLPNDFLLKKYEEDMLHP